MSGPLPGSCSLRNRNTPAISTSTGNRYADSPNSRNAMSANQAPAGPIRLLTALSPLDRLKAGSVGLYESNASSRINATPASTQNADSRSPRIRGTKKVSAVALVFALFNTGSIQDGLWGYSSCAAVTALNRLIILTTRRQQIKSAAASAALAPDPRRHYHPRSTLRIAAHAPATRATIDDPRHRARGLELARGRRAVS